MWILILVLLAPASGLQSQWPLREFSTEEACLIERNRVRLDMAKAYPHDKDFKIECVEAKHA